MSDEYIYLQKSLNVTKESKIDLILNDKTSKDLVKISISKICRSILKYKDSNQPISEYHEFILDDITDYFKLFFDIDCKTEYEIDDVKKYIKEFKKFISYELYNIFSNNFDIENHNIDNIKKFIFNNIYYTLSDNPHKLSLHIFFNQILVSPTSFIQLKKYIINLRSKINNILINNIDLAPFRRNTQLRFIYSKKNDSEYFHSEHDYNIENIEDLKKYIITYKNFNEPHIIIKAKDNNLTNLDVIYPHIKYFRGPHFIRNISKELYNNYKITISDDSIQLFKKKHSAELDEIIDINLIFNTPDCKICGKNSLHKNNRIIKFTEQKIILFKSGNPRNCNTLKYDYPTLSGYELANFIRDLNIIKKIDSDAYVYWKNGKWAIVDNPYIFQGISNMILEKYRNNMLIQDIDYIIKKFFGEAKNRISANLSMNTDIICFNPYIIQFNNGVYDLKESKFYTGENAKKYIRLNYIKIDYKDIEDMSDEEKIKFENNYNILLKLFNLVIPKSNPKRIVFETNLSSVLHYCHKSVITILYGPTSGGKSTIKYLLRQLLFDMFLEPPIEFYQNYIPKNSPNSWLGKVEDKLVSFASEGDVNRNEVFLNKNIKQYTEQYILGRDLNKSKCVHKNTLTQFIDLNPKPMFSSVDPALVKRIAVIEINETQFVNEKLSRDTVNITSDNRNIVIADSTFDDKILNNEFTLPLFYILKKWSKKYHKDTVKLLYTPDFFDKQN
ncbi:putative NTPase [Betaentomopoxvirus amoorei]|uniref:AMV087 n=1 Tax=Amsacta moorei entomopoxvirus TaxID=28321 RepID=Q9EMW2_AMEPV|nr:putative NTPase [Amsacta moorei entomopoxvirus]AAG02793.1 AMV087 [Amsacta moorei entomopoxvirus]